MISPLDGYPSALDTTGFREILLKYSVISRCRDALKKKEARRGTVFLDGAPPLKESLAHNAHVTFQCADADPTMPSGLVSCHQGALELSWGGCGGVSITLYYTVF